MIQTPRKAAVYRLYADDGALLYIGSAYDPEERCKAHQGAKWWPKVARRTVEWLPHRGRAYAEEMKAIATEGARHNAMGAPGYHTPSTDAVRQRNMLASLRGKLITQGGQVSLDTYSAAIEAGYSVEVARRLGAVAEIDFLESTGLFAAAVKWRRRELEWKAPPVA